jgi:hypothetical protein
MAHIATKTTQYRIRLILLDSGFISVIVLRRVTNLRVLAYTRVAILKIMLSKKQILFAYPEVGMSKFDRVFEEISARPLVRQKGALTITASCKHDHAVVDLAVHASLLQEGDETKPIVIYLPWYGGKSAQSREYFDTKRHLDWTHIGIDIFNTKETFDHVLASAVVSQYAYALVIRMMAEQVRLAHRAKRQVGVAGISYGGNILSAYTTRSLETPDALVCVDGGSILQTTLKGKYRGHDCDPRTLQALKQDPAFVPVQQSVTGKAAAISAAVINRDDQIVVGQEEIWQNAAEKMYIRGGHLMGPRLYRRKIRNFANEHFERLLLQNR